MRTLTVDRIVNGFAVCEVAQDGAVTMLDIPLSEIEGSVREGDVLREEAGRYTVDADETQSRQESVRARFERLKRRNAPP